jgi:anhydro-N-acetylmuramic acid kinase
MKAIGLMSGTSMDGVDVALIETDGERIQWIGPDSLYPYDDEEREILRNAVRDSASLKERGERPVFLSGAETIVTEIHAQAVEHFIADHGLRRHEIHIVGFHGQTVLHRPQDQLTVQLGDGEALADLLGINVVYDFRSADVEAGGQGAPLVPIYHRAMADRAGLPRPAVIVNLGGVANVTFIGEDGTLLAFDTGPGNAMIDDWVRRHTGKPRDENGALAARGRTDARRLEALLGDPYFLRKPPKSLDRNNFPTDVIEGLSLEDGAATLTAFSVASLICSLAHFPASPKIFVLCGGGVHNATLIGNIRKLVPGRIETADALGWRGDAIEAQAFAYLAVRSIRGMPITFPGTTGAPRPMSGGLLAPASTLPRHGEAGRRG